MIYIAPVNYKFVLVILHLPFDPRIWPALAIYCNQRGRYTHREGANCNLINAQKALMHLVTNGCL